jgi:hypothetical protein
MDKVKEENIFIILISLSAVLMNVFGYLLNEISIVILPFLVFLHATVHYSSKYSEVIPRKLRIKYSLYFLIFNSVSCFIVLSSIEKSFYCVINEFKYHFIHITLLGAIFGYFLMLLFGKNIVSCKRKVKKDFIKPAKLPYIISILLSVTVVAVYLYYISVLKTSVVWTGMSFVIQLSYMIYILYFICKIEYQ